MSKPKLTFCIVFLGNSITAGYGLPVKHAFPAVLEELDRRFRCVNQGRSGWATTGYRRRLPDIIAAIPPEADACCIELGTNDLRLHGHSGKTLERCTENMRAILESIRQHNSGLKRILMAPPRMDIAGMSPAVRQAGFGPQTNTLLRQLRNRYQLLAAELGIPFIDLFPILDSGDTLDGAHPTAQAHVKLAAHIYAALREILLREE